MEHVSEWNMQHTLAVHMHDCVCERQSDDEREDEGEMKERRDRAGVRRVEGVMTRSAQDRGGDRGGSVSDRLLVAPLWRL